MIRPPKTDSPATDFAVTLLGGLAALGVRDVVVSPGSRSQALALAAAAHARAGHLELRVRLDERSAGFLALGLALEARRPVVVIVTSGTAVANLHPAVLEAHHSGVPLIVVSADRPEWMRGVRASQTARQPGIFGGAVRAEFDVAAPTGDESEHDAALALARDAVAAASGPVHINVAFTEPLSAALTAAPTLPELAPARAADAAEPLRLHPEPGTVVVAGSRAGARAEEVARELGAPLLAEVASGARFGPHLVTAYRTLLDEPGFGDEIRRVVAFGHPTLSRQVPALVQREGVQTVVVRSPGVDDWNPGHRVAAFADAVEVEGDPARHRAWVGRWVSASRALATSDDIAPAVGAPSRERVATELAAVRAPVTRRALAEAVWRATWPHDRLVLGASRLIRDLDGIVTGKKITVHSNRGLAGIDGTVSTAVGVALASQGDDQARPGTTRVLLGDLTLLHEAGGLLFGEGEVRPRIQVVVGDDGGGTIFDGLEVAATAGADFARVLTTAQHVDLESLARAYGWHYVRVDTRGALDQALTATTEPTIVHVPIER